MNLEPTDEQAALRGTVRRFLTEKASVAGHVRPMLDSPTGTTDAVWCGLAELGAMELLIPREYGGTGMTMVEAGVVLEELGAALYPGPWISSAVAAPRALTRLGIDGKAATLLSGLADGSTIATVGGLTASDRGRMRVTERPGGVVLCGDIVVPDAAAADVVLVLADERDGIGVFLVHTSGPGIRLDAQHAIDRTHKRFRLILDDTPAERLATSSRDEVRALVDDVLIGYAADALGAARAVLDLAVAHAKVRRQFDQPIGAFQAVQHLCVDMYETVELARGGILHALWAADRADPDEHHLAAVRAKAFASRLATVGDTAIQIFGGMGYTWEHDAHLYLERLLGWSVFLGSSDQYLRELGSQLLWSVAP